MVHSLKSCVAIGLSLLLLSCKGPVPSLKSTPSIWAPNTQPSPDLAISGISCSRFGEILHGLNMSGKPRSYKCGEFLAHPFVWWGEMSAVYEQRGEWLLLWNKSDNAWFWWKPDYSEIPVPSHRIGLHMTNEEELQRRIQWCLQELESSKSKMDEVSETLVPETAVLKFPKFLPLIHSRPQDDSPISLTGQYFSWCLVTRFEGDWVEIIPGINRGYSGDGRHSRVFDARLYYATWFPSKRGWVRWRKPGPFHGTKQILVN